MGNKIYYSEGGYEEKGELTQEQYIYRKKRRRKRILIAVLCIFCVLIYLKVVVYNDQYFWTKDLINAINQNNVVKVSELLEDTSMDVNNENGIRPSYFFSEEDEQDMKPEKPIEVALQYGNRNHEIIHLLVERGADVNVNVDGENIISIVLESTNQKTEWENIYSLVQFLLDKGAAPDEVQDEIETSPLIGVAAMEIRRGDHIHKERMEITIELYKLIYKHAENKNPCDKISKETPLHEAAWRGNYELVEFLLEETDIDIYAKDIDGYTAYDYAVDEGYNEVAELLALNMIQKAEI